jgi:hypothetical protein
MSAQIPRQPFNRVRVLAFGHENHRAPLRIRRERHILMTLGSRSLINRHTLHLAVIRLKLYRPPSAFLARINSYRTQNQFARALQELGGAVRTKFLLRWIWDEPMRRTVHKCTTRIERYHRFAAQIYKLLG